METFVISFIVFVVAGAALATGLFFGRGPIHGGCRRGASNENCVEQRNCTLRCEKRRNRLMNREKVNVK